MKTNTEIDDSTLIQMHKNGDPNAFSILFKRYKPRLRYYINNIIRDNTVTNDLVQDVFFKALITINSDLYTDQGIFKGWLYTVAHNASINHVRRGSSHRSVSLSTSGDFEEIDNELYFPIVDSTQNPEEIMIRKETHYDIFELINILSPEQREVVILRSVHELKFKEIAKYMNSPESTNRVRMRAALIILREKIKMAES